LETIHAGKTINQIAQELDVHPVQSSQWKKEILGRASSLFEGKGGFKPLNAYGEPEHLYGETDRIKIELNGLKKVRTEPVEARWSENLGQFRKNEGSAK